MIPLWLPAALSFARRYWREGVLALACVVLVAECHARDVALVAKGRAEAETARARADVQRHASNEALLASRYRADTVRLTRTVTVYGSLRDSVRDHIAQLDSLPPDSGRVAPLFREMITQQGRALDAADTVIAACQLARLTCEQRADAADSVAAALRRQLDAMADGTRVSRPSPVARVGRALLWLGAGYAAGRLTHR